MLKKLLILLLLLTMIFACTACGSEGQTESSEAETDVESTEAVSGGWELHDNEANALPEDVQTAFDKAVENLDGNELEPTVLLGTQVVAGTNYAFLCFSMIQTEETITGIQVVTVYEDLEGNAEVANICAVDPADFNE